MLTLRLASIILCIAASYSQNPQITIRALVGSTVNISCTFTGIPTGLIKIYKRHGNDFEAMVKVAGDCHVTADSTLDVSCTCKDSENLLCNITDFKSSNANDQWKCAFFVNNNPVFSNAAVAQNDESTSITQLSYFDVTNTTKVEHTTETSTSVSKEGTPDIKEPSDESSTSEDVLKTEVSISFTNCTNTETTSLPLRRISDEPTDTSQILDDMTVPTTSSDIFSGSIYSTFIIIGVIGVVIILVTMILTCVRRQYGIPTDPTSQLDDTANVVQINESVRSTRDVNATERQCSLVDHYERIPIMDTPLIADNFPLINEDLTQIHDTIFDNEEGANSLHYHVTSIDELESNFEATLCNEADDESETQKSDPVRYESLLRTAPGEKPQYSLLGSR